MRRAVLLISGLLAVYAGWRFGMPYIDTKPEQDKCSFGPVSNTKYRELLAEARARIKNSWPSLDGTTEQKENILRQQVEEFWKRSNSFYESLASMHAVMRAHHAYLEGMEKQIDGTTYGSIPQVFNPATPFGVHAEIHFGYYFHSNTIGEFDLISPYSAVRVIIPLDKTRSFGVYWKVGNVYVSLNEANSGGRFLRMGTSTGMFWNLKDMDCPEIPTDDWLRLYQQYTAQ
jgi:hypothetical protein